MTSYSYPTIIGTPVDRSKYLTHGRGLSTLFVQLFRLYSKCTVLCYERIRSLLTTLYASLTIIGASDGRSEYLTHGRGLSTLFVQLFRLHSKCTVLCYERIRSLLTTLYASLTVIGAPDGRSEYLTHGRGLSTLFVQLFRLYSKCTVLCYERIRSLLTTLYASLTIIGAPDGRSGYQDQYPRSCFAHCPDCSSVST